MKCEICKTKIEETFLRKLKGTVVKDEKGKIHHICPGCQRKIGTKYKILEHLK